MDTNTQPSLLEAKIYQPLVSSFEKLTDLRFKRGILYQLKRVVILLFLSKLGGADTPAEIAGWVSFRFDELKSLLWLDWKGSPREVTWKRMLENAIEVSHLERSFGKYLQEMLEEEKNLLNLDGKWLCVIKAEETSDQRHLLV